jgi:hypothetical protein
MTESALTTVVPDRIWCLERPVWFSGARLRARTTVLRLDVGSLLLHTPAPPNDALADALSKLGPVRWLVVPNCWHHLGAPAAAARFQEARLVAPASALRRNGALKVDLDLHDGQFAKLVPELEALPLAGVPFWDETFFYHRPTQTLLGADIVCSAAGAPHLEGRSGTPNQQELRLRCGELIQQVGKVLGKLSQGESPATKDFTGPCRTGDPREPAS